MITLGTNGSNSIYLNEFGSLVVLSDAQALAQTLGHISQTRRAEMMYATDKGIPYWDTIFMTKDVLMFEAAMRNEFLSHPEVTGIESFTVNIDGETLTYEAKVNSIYGEVLVNG
jgi:hypothetical protein